MAAASPVRLLRHLQGAFYRRGTSPHPPPAPLGRRARADVEEPSMLSGGAEAAAALTYRRAEGCRRCRPQPRMRAAGAVSRLGRPRAGTSLTSLNRRY